MLLILVMRSVVPRKPLGTFRSLGEMSVPPEEEKMGLGPGGQCQLGQSPMEEDSRVSFHFPPTCTDL